MVGDAATVELPRAAEAAVMARIEDYLSSMRWPRQETHKRSKGRWGSTHSQTKHVTGRLNVGGAAREAFVLGKARKWDDHVKLHESVHNKKHPELWRMLKDLMRLHNPHFRYNAIQLNRNVHTQPHYDKRNSGYSYCLALGPHRGGGLRVYSPQGRTATDIDNRHKWVRYNGQRTLHATIPARSGVRFAVIYYLYKLGKRSPSAPRPRRSPHRARSK